MLGLMKNAFLFEDSFMSVLHKVVDFEGPISRCFTDLFMHF